LEAVAGRACFGCGLAAFDGDAGKKLFERLFRGRLRARSGCGGLRFPLRSMIVLDVFMRATAIMLEFKMAAVAIVVLVTFAAVTSVPSERGRERSS
jgi:hypothetical protein